MGGAASPKLADGIDYSEPATRGQGSHRSACVGRHVEIAHWQAAGLGSRTEADEPHLVSLRRHRTQLCSFPNVPAFLHNVPLEPGRGLTSPHPSQCHVPFHTQIQFHCRQNVPVPEGFPPAPAPKLLQTPLGRWWESQRGPEAPWGGPLPWLSQDPLPPLLSTAPALGLGPFRPQGPLRLSSSINGKFPAR